MITSALYYFKSCAKLNGSFGVLLLTALIIYTPNQLHFPSSLGFKGLNVYNILFILTLLMSTGYKDTKTPLNNAYIAFFLVCLIGLIISLSNIHSNFLSDLTYLKNIIFYMAAYYLSYRYAKNYECVKYILSIVLFVAMIASIEAVREAYGYGFSKYIESHRVSGPFGVDFYSANRAGVFYSMFAPLFLYLYINLKASYKYKLFLFFGFMLAVLAVIFTYSRQSYFIIAFCLLYLIAKNSKFILIVFLVAMPFYESWVPESAIQRVEGTQQIDENTGDEKLDVSTESRFIIWAAAWNMIQEHPFGIGINQFQPSIEPYLGYKKDAHNHYILTFAELGIQGLFIFLVFIYSIFNLIKRANNASVNNLSRGIVNGFYFVSIAMLLSNIYGSPFYTGEVMFLYWILLGLVSRVYILGLENIKYETK